MPRQQAIMPLQPIFLLLLSNIVLVQKVTYAFVASAPPPRRRQYFVSIPRIIITPAASSPTTTTTTKIAMMKNNNNSKNFVDEILDALDTMAGVSPLTETDLKRNQQGNNAAAAFDSTSNSKASSLNCSNEIIEQQQQQQQQWLVQRQAQREQVAPPKDALQKPSVSIFFALLGIIPSLLLLYAVSFGGIKPFGL